MDIKTAVRVIKALPPHISVLIRGGHGIGKSEVVRQIADDLSCKLLDRRMSQCSEGDTVGLPKQTVVSGPNGKNYDITAFCPPEFIAIAKMEKSVLFLDELNRATPEVMQACFQYALDRCDFQGDKFHSETRVFAAINTGANYQVNDLDPALLDRFFVIDLTPSAEDFFAHAEGRLDQNMVTFLKERETRLDPAMVNPGTKQPSRRTWFRADAALKANDMYNKDYKEDMASYGFLYSLMSGFVGIDSATDFSNFMKNRELAFTAKHVLDEFPKHMKAFENLGQDKINTLIDSIIEDGKKNVWTAAQSKKLGKFIGLIPAELRVSFITNFTKSLRSLPNFTPNFKVINPTVMPHIVRVFNPEAQFENSDEGVSTEKIQAAQEVAVQAKKSKK